MKITLRVGILTSGLPDVETTPAGHRVHNALIGAGFHWQRTYPLTLPLDATVAVDEEAEIPLTVALDIEDYVASVVSSEMNPQAPAEFIKAHAIISRSWVLGKVLKSHAESADGKLCDDTQIVTWDDTAAHGVYTDAESRVHGCHVCNDDHCQRFQGLDAVNAAARQAVADTRGVIIADGNGEVIDARFSKCCGGRSERFSECWQDVDYDYLQPVDDPWCDLSQLDPHERRQVLQTVLKDYDRDTTPDYHDWTEEIDATAVAANLRRKFGRDVGAVQALIPLRRGASGRISSLQIVGEQGTLVLGKELAIRRLLSDTHLLSSAFDVERYVDAHGCVRFRLRGRGWGHGVGLCQIGAAVMAHRGFTAAEILRHYYPHTTLKQI